MCRFELLREVSLRVDPTSLELVTSAMRSQRYSLLEVSRVCMVDYGGGPPGRGRLVSAQENKAVARRYIEEVWNRHSIEATDELVSPNYLSAEYQRAGVKYSLNWLFSVFPDHRFDIEDAAADGDTVPVRARAAPRTRASSGASRRRASVSLLSRFTGSASQTAR